MLRNGRQAIVSAGEGTVRLWDIALARELRRVAISDQREEVARGLKEHHLPMPPQHLFSGGDDRVGGAPGCLTWLVVRDVTALVVTGIAIGSVLSWTGVMVFESSVTRIVGVNLWAVVLAALIIVACGAAAAYAPSRRAVLTDPIAAIRHQ